MTSEQQRAWDVDPSPSWDDLANAADFAPLLTEDTPESPAGDITAIAQKLWPAVPFIVQEARTHAI